MDGQGTTSGQKIKFKFGHSPSKRYNLGIVQAVGVKLVAVQSGQKSSSSSGTVRAKGTIR